MRKFLLKTLLFLLPVLAVLALAETYVRQLPNSYRYKDQWMWSNGHRVSTLVLGNSHAYYALNPSLLGDSAFNLANVSQELEYDYYLLKRYASVCTHLSTVLLTFDNSCLFDIPLEDDEPPRVTYYQLYMGLRKHSLLSRYGFEVASMTCFWQKVLSHLAGEGLSCDSLGWGRDYQLSLRNPDNLLDNKVKRHRFVNWESTLRNRDYLDSIASWCRQHDIRLLLLQTPVSAAYTRQAERWQLNLVKQMTDSCTSKYGYCPPGGNTGNGYVLSADFSCDSRFTDLDFFDSDHLDDQGAAKFSTIVRAHLVPCPSHLEN